MAAGARMSSVRRCGFWLACALAAATGCGASLAPPDGGSDAPFDRVPPADALLCTANPSCAAYCSHVLAAGCAWNVSPAQLLAQCVQDCESQHTLIPVDCLSTWATAMACASCGAVQCPRQTCVQDGSVCIAEGLQVSGCDDSANALKACAGACTASSLVEGASLPEGSFETKTTGCVCPAALRPGRAAGEACQSSSDCAEVCCGCSNSRGRFVIRACKAGRCLGDPGICTDSIGTAQFGAC